MLLNKDLRTSWNNIFNCTSWDLKSNPSLVLQLHILSESSHFWTLGPVSVNAQLNHQTLPHSDSTAWCATNTQAGSCDIEPIILVLLLHVKGKLIFVSASDTLAMFMPQYSNNHHKKYNMKYNS